jgi:hypothetical protein
VVAGGVRVGGVAGQRVLRRQHEAVALLDDRAKEALALAVRRRRVQHVAARLRVRVDDSLRLLFVLEGHRAEQ